jgi:hypothetical protein
LKYTIANNQQRKGYKLADLRKSLGASEAFGFSLSIIAPTLAMAFATALTAQSAGRAGPLAYLISGTIVAQIINRAGT